MPYILFGLLALFVAALLGSPPRTSSLSDVGANAIITSLSVLGAAATSQVFFPATLPRFGILADAGLTAVWLVVFGVWSALRLRRAGAALRVVAVVNPNDGRQLRIDVDAGPWERHFSLVDVIDDDRHFDRISEICRTGRATTLVLGPRATVTPEVLAQSETLHSEGMHVRSLDAFYDEYLGKLPLSSLDRFGLMTDVDSVQGSYALLKRALDVGLASIGLVVLAILLPFVIVGNLIANRGPLWFSQERVGQSGHPFKIWKFRTMRPGAVDVSGWTSEDDPRITGFGRFLRRTHIDELPQVANIFIGNLSVVGPRPEQVDYVRTLSKALPFYSARTLVRPGLTGWAQVRYRYAASQEDAYVKLQYDLHYIRHESLRTDLRIIILTISHLIRGGGR